MILGNTRQIIICLLCKKEVWDFSDLEKHFNQNHPEKLNELLYKLNKSSDDTHGIVTFMKYIYKCTYIAEIRKKQIYR
jgi:hypothetical protein